MLRILVRMLLVIFLSGAEWPAPHALAQQVEQGTSLAGEVEPGRLGAELGNLREQSVQALGLSQTHALLVKFAAPGGPAERAGLRPGDVIVDLEGVAVRSFQDFVKAIQGLGAGRTITLGILRGGKRVDVPATLGSLSDARKAPSGAPSQKQPGYVGVNLRDLLQQSVKALGLKQSRALLVRQSLPGSPADQAGLKTADVVLALDGAPVTTAELFDAVVLQREPGQEIRLDILRDRAPLTISIVVGVDSLAAESVNVEEQIERAIRVHHALLDAFDQRTFPLEWAITQRDLGIGYAAPTRRNRAHDQDKAIYHLEEAFRVITREETPREWAAAQDLLGMAYAMRVHGDRSDNQEKAIAAFENALTLRHETANEHASALSNLGEVYLDRLRGDHADNVEKSIAALRASLLVEKNPGAQMSLAAAYRRRPRGNKGDNQEEALAIMGELQKVLTRASSPLYWGSMQQELALLYSERINGDQAENQEKAIEHLQQGLSFFSEAAWPLVRAEAHALLGNAYQSRIRGKRADNLERAIAAYNAALKVQATLTSPRNHLSTAVRLGIALLQSGELRKARLAYAEARDSFLTLFGQGLNEVEAGNLLAQAGPLFAEASFAAARDGDLATAFKLAVEGRARLMAVALKLQTLDLPADKRQRLDDLRAAIRTADRTVEATQGTERAAAVERLASLRHELLGLVKEGDAGQGKASTALAQARDIAGKGGAVVVPIITEVGGKLLIVTKGITVLDLPELTTHRLNLLIRGATKDSNKGGWIGAYNINYLQDAELDKRWPEWLAAVGDLGPELWRLFGGKLDAALKARGLKPGARLVWLPSGALGILPLGLAQEPVSKHRFADSYEIVYAPSLEALTSAQRQIAKATPATLAAIVNPTDDLAGTEKEGRLVASHFPDKARAVLMRGAATPDAVLAALKGKTHWHFASHGTFSWDDARQSALVMHDRTRLTVGRLLEADGLGRPRLVVLSACETGLHDIDRNPDEFIGLPGTFTALGAAGVLGTLWPVSDAATALLIARFYELHMGERLAPPTALRRAQQWLRQATNADLATYARLAVKQGRLETRHVAEIEQELSEEGLTRSRNNAAIEWVDPQVTSAPGRKAKRVARPYAHPYFWAGFIHTGL